MLSLPFSSVALLLSAIAVANAQSTGSGSGYTGYSMSVTGDDESTTYDTASTPANVSTTVPEPDVFLNATVFVGEIDIEVDNLTAKINLDAEVLQLLQFNAGVDVSIDRVSLLIQNVSAHVVLEARLENVVAMISDVLDSIDLNPIIATLSNDVGDIVNSTVGGLTGSGSSGSSGTSALDKRSYDLVHNILYSVNDYSGNKHTNRVLLQNGTMVDQSLHNNGQIYNQHVVGSYLTDMSFNGYNKTVTKYGQTMQELEYVYSPFYGLSIVSAVFTNTAGTVIATQVLSESGAGGSSTISDL